MVGDCQYLEERKKELIKKGILNPLPIDKAAHALFMLFHTRFVAYEIGIGTGTKNIEGLKELMFLFNAICTLAVRSGLDKDYDHNFYNYKKKMDLFRTLCGIETH